jgi:hypothetical protein
LKKLSEAKETFDRGNVSGARSKLRDVIDYVNERRGRGIAVDATAVLVGDTRYVIGTL